VNELGAIVAALGRRGVGLEGFDEAFVALALQKRLTATACDVAAYLALVEADPAELAALQASLRVSYSRFFRNPLSFALLEQVVVPGLQRSLVEGRSREVRVWSAGCAAGQEAFSVAILLAEATGGQGAGLPFRVIATDVAEPELDRAREAVFTDDELSDVRLAHLRRYFVPQGDTWRVADRLAARVDLSTHDLLDPRLPFPAASIYGGFDLVLCCNVLLYYSPSRRRTILANLRHGLRADGVLVVGEAERAFVQGDRGFRELLPLAPVFHKTSFEAVHP
jgi:chemotaxis methyl-accepting protein methylase